MYIDWCPITNRIVSCSHDRNAFVWTYEPETIHETIVISATWKPALVILRIDRAAIDVKWSLDGRRFAVTSGSKCVPVCTYETSNDWWVSKTIKKHKSTVLCCAFHPTNGQLLATGSSDFKCRVFSTFSTDVDGSNVNAGPFIKPIEFGETYLELSSSGWVNAVAWSPSGRVLAFASQDSTITFVTFTSDGNQITQKLRLKDLPFNKILFISEKAVVGVGHDFNPTIVSELMGQWSVNRKLDEKADNSTDAGGGSNNSVAAARALFVNKSSKGQDAAKESDGLWTKHESAISCISNASSSSEKRITKISTSSADGRIVVWDLAKIPDISKLLI